MWVTERGLGITRFTLGWVGLCLTPAVTQISGTNQTLQMLHRNDQIAEGFTSLSWRKTLLSRQCLPQLQDLLRKCLGEEDWDSLYNTHSSKWEYKMLKGLVISKQNIQDFLSFISNEDIDAKTWKEGEWGKDCSTGQEAERIKTATSLLWPVSIWVGFSWVPQEQQSPCTV